MKINFRTPVEVEAKNFYTSTSKLEGATGTSDCLLIKAANASHDTFYVYIVVSRKETIVSICDATGQKASITLVGGEPTCVKGEKCEVRPTMTQVWWGIHSVCLFEGNVAVSLYDTDSEELLYATFSVGR